MSTLQDAPEAVAEVARAVPQPLAGNPLQASLDKPVAGSRAPDSEIRGKGAFESASRQKAAQVCHSNLLVRACLSSIHLRLQHNCAP